jgi:mono/diheme cytochrome c family protein
MPGLHRTESPRGLGIGAVLLGAALVASGCGAVKRGADANVIQGKVAFVSKCGACHTLARAGTKGVIGPNLDYAFAQSLADGEKRAAVRSVVHDQILLPNPRGAMPANLVTGKHANDVAAYVAQSVDKPGQDTGLLLAAVPTAGSGKPAVEQAGKLEIDADPNGQLAYVTLQATAKPGPVTIAMKNASTVGHNIALQQGTNGPVLGNGPVVNTGGLSNFKATVKPGTYTYFCQVPGHRQAGMLGTLTVK